MKVQDNIETTVAKTFVYDEKMKMSPSITNTQPNNQRRLMPRNTSGAPETSLDNKHGGAQLLFRSVSPSGKTQPPNTPPICKNCLTSTTPLWRRDENGAVLCNACGLFLKLHGRSRPISLKTDTIKPRNRKGTLNMEGTKETSATPIAPKKVTKTPSKRKKNKDDAEGFKSSLETPRLATSTYKPTGHTSIQTKSHVSEVGKQHSHYHSNSVASNSSAYSANLGNGTPISNNGHVRHTPTHTMVTQLPSVSTLLSDINTENRLSENAQNRNCGNEPRPLSHQSGTLSTFDADYNRKVSPRLMNPINTPTITSSNIPIQPGDIDGAHRTKSDISHSSTSLHHSSKLPAILTLKDHLTTTRSNTHASLNSQDYTSANASPSLDNSDSITPFNSRDGELQHTNISGLDTIVQKMQRSDSIYDDSSQLSAALKNEEEIIKLKTKVEELEMVINMYKKHIFELDRKYQTLKERIEENNTQT